MDMHSRLKKAMQLRKLTVADLAPRIGISKAALYFMLDGTSGPDGVRYSTVQGLCRALRIRPEWLMSGLGAMESADASHPAEIDADTIRYAQEALRAIAQIGGIKQGILSEQIMDPEKMAIAVNTVLEVKLGQNANTINFIDLISKIAEKIREHTEASIKISSEIGN